MNNSYKRILENAVALNLEYYINLEKETKKNKVNMIYEAAMYPLNQAEMDAIMDYYDQYEREVFRIYNNCKR